MLLFEIYSINFVFARVADMPWNIFAATDVAHAPCSSVLSMPSLGMENDGPLEAIAAAGPPRRRPTASWSRAALINMVRRRTSADSGHSKEEPGGPEGRLCTYTPQHAALHTRSDHT